MEAVTTSVADTAKALGIGLTKTWELIGEGRLETIRVGRRRLVKTASIRRLVETA